MIKLSWFEKNQDYELPYYDEVIKKIKNKEGKYLGKIYNYPYYIFSDEFGEITFILLDKGKKVVIGLLIMDIIKDKWYQTRLIVINSKYQQRKLGLKLYQTLIKNNHLKLISDTKQSDGGIKLWKHLYQSDGIEVIASLNSDFTKFSEVELIDNNLEATFPLYDTSETYKITKKLEIIKNRMSDIYDYLDNINLLQVDDNSANMSNDVKKKIFELYSEVENLEKEKNALEYEYRQLVYDREDALEQESILIAIPSKDKSFFIENVIFEESSRVVKGVNTTADIGVDEIKKQAKKFGNTVDKDGYPPILNNKARKNTTTNKLFNLGIGNDNTISESLNTPYSYNWVLQTENSWTAKSKTKDGREIDVRFVVSYKPHNRWDMAFIVDGVDEKTNKGDQFKIFSTVIEIVKDFISKVKPNVLVFYGRAEDGSLSRINLYKKMAYSLTKNTDYNVNKFTVNKGTQYETIFIKLINKNFDDVLGISEEYTPLEIAIMEGGHTLEENWKDKVKKTATAAALGLVGLGGMATKDAYADYMKAQNLPSSTASTTIEPITTSTPRPRDEIQVQTPSRDTIRPRARPTVAAQSSDEVSSSMRPKPRPTTLNLTGSDLENYILNYAIENGLSGIELVAFMAQVAHETRNFQRMVETGSRNYFNKYEKNHSPDIANNLGNTRNGDGFKYRGRGFVQLTGRYNYNWAKNDLGLDLINNPDLASEIDNAALIAIWYWQNRVAKRTQNFENVERVSRLISGGETGLQDRTEKFNRYSERFKIISNQTVEESEIVDLDKKREEQKLKAFHKDFMNKLKTGVSEMQAAYEIAVEQGMFDDLPVGTRFTLPKGSSYIVKGHTMTGSKTDQLQARQIEFRKEYNFGPPMFIKGETRFYRPMINAEAVGGEEAGSTMSFELDKLVNFETGEKRYKKFTGPKLAENDPDQVKGKEPMPKKSKPSKNGFQDHPYRNRLVGETVLDATPLLVSFFENILKNETILENKIDNTNIKKFIDSYKISPKLGNNYFYCSFVLHDFFPMINFAYTENSYQLLKIDNGGYIFDINDKNIKFPQYKNIGDAIMVSLLFDNEIDLQNFMADLYLQFSEYRISKSVIDKNILKENISITGTERARLAKKKGLEPGTDEWFDHWFSLPYMIDQRKKKYRRRRMGVKPIFN
jgi:putative chitinase